MHPQMTDRFDSTAMREVDRGTCKAGIEWDMKEDGDVPGADGGEDACTTVDRMSARNVVVVDEGL